MNYQSNAAPVMGTPEYTAQLNNALAGISLQSEPLAPPQTSSAYDVTNSGIYSLFIQEAWLGTRLVQGVTHDVIYVKGAATHKSDPSHAGNLFFTVPLVQNPLSAHPRDIDLMRTFLCITGCTEQGPNGAPVIKITTQIEQTKKGTTRAVIPALSGKEICVAIKSNEYKGKRYLNPVGFMGADLRSWDEISKNIPAAAQYQAAFSTLVSEGHALQHVERSEAPNDGNPYGAPAYGAPAYGAPAAPAYAAPAQQAPYQTPPAYAPQGYSAPAPAAPAEPNPYGQWGAGQ